MLILNLLSHCLQIYKNSQSIEHSKIVFLRIWYLNNLRRMKQIRSVFRVKQDKVIKHFLMPLGF